MKTYSLFQDIDITLCDWKPGIYETHKHHFFEILYVFDGKGKHRINDQEFTYEPNNIFILIPGDEHNLNVIRDTKFCVILFNNLYFSKNARNMTTSTLSDILKKLEFIIHNSKYIEQPITVDISEKTLITHLMSCIIAEYKKKDVFYDIIIQNAVLLLMSFIARTIKNTNAGKLLITGSKSTVADIVLYIQENIFDSERTKVINIASHFKKPKQTLTTQFKSQTGYNLKDFILNFKLSAVKQQLLQSNISVRDLAAEFGFTDENHLNKFLKQRTGMTAKDVRKNPQANNL